MNIEIERKFLLKNNSWKNNSWKKNIQGTHYIQGYLSKEEKCTVRVRTAGNKAYLTIKGKTSGISRKEFEYEIPHQDALELLKLSKTPLVEKIRYIVKYDNDVWEIDEFLGKNEGLVIAEIELNAENQYFEQPEWLGEEVTGQKKYYNSHLAVHPFSDWI
jgi:CYTH domain-containing protein